MYFDAVMTEAMDVIFNGTPKEVNAWLKENGWLKPDSKQPPIQVCIGRTLEMVSPSEYLSRS